jgi:spore coat protein U-like protein
MTKWTRYEAMVSVGHRQRTKIHKTATVIFLVMCLPFPVQADCSFSSVTDVGFGTYNVFDLLPNSSGVGSISIRCRGNESDRSYDVTLSRGQSQSYTSRIMQSGANILNYNIYTSASRSIVWGDGTGGSHTQTAYKNSTTVLDLFGQIPAGQDVANGIYIDNLIATVNF